MVVATQEVFLHTKAEIWDAGAATPERTLIKQASSGRYGVTLTDTVGVTKPAKTLWGGVQVTGRTQPGFSNDKASAVGTYATGVALDGTWEFESITGADLTTVQGTPVYVTAGGALTLTSTSNTLVGYANYPGTYAKVAGTLPVKIGA